MLNRDIAMISSVQSSHAQQHHTLHLSSVSTQVNLERPHQSADPGLGSSAQTLGPPHIRTFPLTHTASIDFLLPFDFSSQTTKTTFDNHPTYPSKYHRNGT